MDTTYTLVFIDTETTGNQPEDELCQIAYKIGDDVVNEFFKPSIPIKIGAMAVHHITEKMVADKEPFDGSKRQQTMRELFAEDKTIFIAHNAKFDVGMIEKGGVQVGKVIDTYKIARHLDPDGKIESYALQYLRYLLDIEVEATAHDALGDILVLEELFNRLLKKIMQTENISADTAIEQMIDISSRPILIRYFQFGKYKNQGVEEVASSDPGYLQWLLDQKLQSEQDEEDWIYTLKHFLGQK